MTINELARTIGAAQALGLGEDEVVVVTWDDAGEERQTTGVSADYDDDLRCLVIEGD
jgi:hypothetical protein